MIDRSKSSFPRGRQGQMRLVEVVFAALIVFLVFSFGSYAMTSTSTPIVRGKGELEVTAYNLLHRLAQEGTFERTVMSGIEDWELELKLVITRMSWPSLYFNVTIFNATMQGPVVVSLEPLNHEPITNVRGDEASEAFSKSPEVAAVRYVYTSYRGSILVFRMAIAKAGARA